MGVEPWRWASAASVASIPAVGLSLGRAIPLETDHLTVLVLMTVGVALARRLDGGGPRSVAALAGSLLLSQSLLHVAGEAGEQVSAPAVTHQGLAGLALLACHLAFAIVLFAGLHVLERARAGLRAVLRRWARMLVASVRPARVEDRVGPTGPSLSHARRDTAPRPPRRGPPDRHHLVVPEPVHQTDAGGRSVVSSRA